MAESIFDHDRLDIYRLSIDYVALSFKIAKELNGCHRHARDQWLRADQSIPLNIAEGTDGPNEIRHGELKRLLDRIVSMLIRLIARSNVVVESEAEYRAGIEYEYRWRSCLRLDFLFRWRSFGILIYESFQSRTGDFHPTIITPVPGVPNRCTCVAELSFLTWSIAGDDQVIACVGHCKKGIEKNETRNNNKNRDGCRC